MLSTIIILVVVGILMIAIEFFLPGGIIGIFGCLALMASVFLAYQEFAFEVGTVLALSILIFVVLSLVLWLKLFDKTAFGRKMTLSATAGHVAPAAQTLLHQIGETTTDLRPVGKALIGDTRVEVTAESGTIPVGSEIEVIRVENTRVIVRKVDPQTSSTVPEEHALPKINL